MNNNSDNSFMHTKRLKPIIRAELPFLFFTIQLPASKKKKSLPKSFLLVLSNISLFHVFFLTVITTLFIVFFFKRKPAIKNK